ncbi:calcium-independent phospholipase A2-gamma [Octopus bimaculoides]|uniref:PNPLA domain-containing protein n=1 Tax=Octopus bimaculoides TaxID=37653 RepID=A0A0L8GRZ7_OCTBM|nr:calcium-independent phospholipase A2-gamma [Octopus bimaculoides]|eukprot:XP_014778854.1 PREDICTED: calcium-independent phospholipase A2-gamma-like [Octopus bimaculoides]
MSSIRSVPNCIVLKQKQFIFYMPKSWPASTIRIEPDQKCTTIHFRTVTKDVTSKKKRDFLYSVKDQLKNLVKRTNNFGNVATLRETDINQMIKNYYKFVEAYLENLKHAKDTKHPPSKNSYTSIQKTKDLSTFEEMMKETHESVASFYESKKNVRSQVSAKSISTASEDLNKNEPNLNKLVSWVTVKKDLDEEKTDVKKKPVIRKDFISRTAVENRSRALVNNLKLAQSISSKITRIDDLNKHLMIYPASRSIAKKAGAVQVLLRLSQSEVPSVRSRAYEALSLVGYVSPPKGRGIRILSIDGGGTRGVIALETLCKLQEACKTDLWKLFDYVCGVSTGALMLGLIILYRIPPDECCKLYKKLSQSMFTRNKFVGTGHLMWSHAFYDTKVWEDILRNHAGDTVMSKFSQKPDCPKMSALSCVVNMAKMKNYVFRTYNLPSGVYSQYPGSCKYQLWEAIRASSAAPGYYTEFQLDDLIHQDGGLLTNNPTALAIHECRLLWPDTPLQCVVSVGNGRYEPNLEMNTNKSSLKEKVVKILDSATDTEAVNTTLTDLLHPSSYFRFNPYLSEPCTLDEIRMQKLEQMQHDTRMYLRKNEYKVQRCAEKLLEQRHLYQKGFDWLQLKKDMLNK